MKVVDVSEFYAEQGGGVRTYSHQKLQAAAELGHECVIVAPGLRDGEERRSGGRIVWLKSPRLPVDPRYHWFSDAAALHAVLERETPDIVEGSSPWSAGWLVSRWRGRVPRVLVFHQDPVAVYAQTLLDRIATPASIDRLCAPYWKLLQRLAARYTRTVAAADWLALRLRAQGVSNAVAVPFGCDTSGFDPNLRDPDLRAELLARTGLGPDALLLVCVSRHHPEKRLHTLCKAVRVLHGRGHAVGLVILGDGPMRRFVEAWAKEAGNVHVAGFLRDRAEVARILASADLMVHGSSAETFGIAVAEALSSGLPVVVPERGGAAELAPAACSETYRPGDAEACAAAVERLSARRGAELQRATLHAAANVPDQREHFRALFGLYASLALSPQRRPGDLPTATQANLTGFDLIAKPARRPS